MINLLMIGLVQAAQDAKVCYEAGDTSGLVAATRKLVPLCQAIERLITGDVESEEAAFPTMDVVDPSAFLPNRVTLPSHNGETMVFDPSTMKARR